MDTKEAPIIPVKQALIPLAGYQFLVVRLPSGDIAIVLNYLCRAIGIDRWGQVQRIQEHPLLAEYLVTVQIKTAKGERIVNALIVWALSGWLSGFQLTRLSEDQRRVIIALQREAFNTFVRPFFSPETDEQLNQPKQAPQSPPPLPPQGEPPQSVAEMRRALASRIEQEDQRQEARLTTVEQGQQELERRQQELEGRQRQLDHQQAQDVAVLAEIRHQLQVQREELEALRAAVIAGASAPAPEALLSAEHHQTLRLLLVLWQRATGQPIAEAEREVVAAAGAMELRLIREAAWGKILAWFWRRLA